MTSPAPKKWKGKWRGGGPPKPEVPPPLLTRPALVEIFAQIFLQAETPIDSLGDLIMGMDDIRTDEIIAETETILSSATSALRDACLTRRGDFSEICSDVRLWSQVFSDLFDKRFDTRFPQLRRSYRRWFPVREEFVSDNPDEPAEAKTDPRFKEAYDATPKSAIDPRFEEFYKTARIAALFYDPPVWKRVLDLEENVLRLQIYHAVVRALPVNVARIYLQMLYYTDSLIPPEISKKSGPIKNSNGRDMVAELFNLSRNSFHMEKFIALDGTTVFDFAPLSEVLTEDEMVLFCRIAPFDLFKPVYEKSPQLSAWKKFITVADDDFFIGDNTFVFIAMQLADMPSETRMLLSRYTLLTLFYTYARSGNISVPWKVYDKLANFLIVHARTAVRFAYEKAIGERGADTLQQILRQDKVPLPAAKVFLQEIFLLDQKLWMELLKSFVAEVDKRFNFGLLPSKYMWAKKELEKTKFKM